MAGNYTVATYIRCWISKR